MLFTCFVTRAVHLELLRDGSAEEVLAAIERFVNRRGAPKEILSDNAANFKKVDKILGAIWLNSDQEKFREKLTCFFAEKGIIWRYIPEGTPWMGGFYEL